VDPLYQYKNLDLWVERDSAGKYVIRGKSDEGDLRDAPASDIAALAVDPAGVAPEPHPPDYVKALGVRLYQFLFHTATESRIQGLLDRSLGASRGDYGVRLRLQLAEVNPEVAAIPWEFLYAEPLGGFLASSVETPVVRFLEAGIRVFRPEARLPLNLLAVIPAVTDLDVDAEKARLTRAVQGIDPPVTITWLEGTVTRERFSDALTDQDIDILHFIGHGGFEGDKGRLRLNLNEFDPDWIDHVALGELVKNHKSLKLVVLNTCRGAEISSTRAFAGVAPALVLAGVPAVVAMQFPITDQEALTFVHGFYHALFQGSGRGSVDAAITAGRSALSRDFPGTRAVGLPALFMRYNEGVLFQVVSGTGKLSRDAPYRPEEAAKERAVIRELERNTEELAARPPGSLDPGAVQDLAEQRGALGRARARLRFRNWVIATPVAVSLLLVLAAAINLLDRLTLTWIVAASPVWLGDPLAGKLPVDSFVIVTTHDSITPAWRPRHAALVDKLSRAGARVVAFDVRFRDSSPYDPVLAAAVDSARARGTQVVGGSKTLDGESLGIAPALVGRVAPGLDCLGRSPLEFSGVVPLVWSRSDGGDLQPSLALAILAAWRNGGFNTDLARREVVLTDRTARVLDRVRLAKVTRLLKGQPGCAVMTAGSRYGEMLAVRAPLGRWRDPIRKFDYSAVEAMTPERLAAVRGRIVLVGAEVDAERYHQLIGLRSDDRYGVERHADAVATMLGDAELVPVADAAQYGFLAALAGLGGWLAYLGPRRRLARATLTALAVLAGLAVASTIVYWTGHRLLNILYPALAFLITFVSLLLLRRRWLP